MRVGTRVTDIGFDFCEQDHPHACGDKMANKIRFLITAGSSPCVWGQVLKVSGANLTIRIIPMRVGTSTHCHKGQYER